LSFVAMGNRSWHGRYRRSMDSALSLSSRAGLRLSGSIFSSPRADLIDMAMASVYLPMRQAVYTWRLLHIMSHDINYISIDLGSYERQFHVSLQT
jgi:hypothetical protein